MTRHQIRVSSDGENSAGVCQGGVTTPYGVNWSGHTIRVTDVKLPPVPIIEAIEIAVTDTVTNEEYDMPAIYSMSELVNWFDSLTHSQTGGRMIYAFYALNEFEVCIAINPIALDPGLAALLKFPTTIPVNCFSSHVDVATFAPVYKGYVVKLVGSEVHGIHSRDIVSDVSSPEAVEQTVAILNADQDCSRTPQLSFRTRPNNVYTKVYYRDLNNTLTMVPLDDAEYFEVVYDLAN